MRSPTFSSRAGAIIALVLAAVMQGKAQQETVLHNFPSSKDDGANNYGSLVRDAAGNLYGATTSGGSYGVGTVYMLSPRADGGWSETILHEFNNNGDGYLPYAGVALDAAGNIYGTTCFGGAFDLGTVYEISSNAKGARHVKILHSFRGSGVDGECPYAGVVLGASGSLYGTTTEGGENYEGTVFQMTPMPDGTWDEKIVHNFPAACCIDVDGNTPHGGLTFDSAGNLYGTTVVGGSDGGGVVFELLQTPTGWEEKILHSFSNNGVDGLHPYAGVTLDSRGNLFGATIEGGDCAEFDCGTVFELIPTADGPWREGIIHNFTPGQNSDGGTAYGGVVFDAAGNLYGTTSYAGTYNGGVVFELTPRGEGWSETILYAFDLEVIDGTGPTAAVVLDGEGHVYGTTLTGGREGGGFAFEITP